MFIRDRKEKEVIYCNLGLYMNPYFTAQGERQLMYDRFFNVVKHNGMLLIEENLAHA
jgi:hypothetical protein